jgi:hypothetical protein
MLSEQQIDRLLAESLLPCERVEIVQQVLLTLIMSRVMLEL